MKGSGFLDAKIMELRVRKWLPIFEEQAKSGLSKRECKANGADVRIYLQYLLEKIPAAMDKGSADSKEFLDGMMPWSPEYRAYEEAMKKSAMDSYRSLFPEPEKPRTPLKGIRKPDQKDPPIANSA